MNRYSLISRAVCMYLRKKYGGNVSSLKPPIGFHLEYSMATIGYKLAYLLVRKPMWQFDSFLFHMFGAGMRDVWKTATNYTPGSVAR